MKHLIYSDATMPGFQIAPMIDVVFVIMLFFMVMAGEVKMERELVTTLPGGVISDPAHTLKFPDNEVTIGISEDGMVTMNDEAFDAPRDKALPLLTATLRRLAESSTRQKQTVLVTIQAEEQSAYERVIDVLSSLHKAQIQNVTFTVGSQPL